MPWRGKGPCIARAIKDVAIKARRRAEVMEATSECLRKVLTKTKANLAMTKGDLALVKVNLNGVKADLALEKKKRKMEVARVKEELVEVKRVVEATLEKYETSSNFMTKKAHAMVGF